jgi:hypothetical protein
MRLSRLMMRSTRAKTKIAPSFVGGRSGDEMTEGMSDSAWVAIGLAVVAYVVQGFGLFRKFSDRFAEEKLERTKALSSAVTERDAQIDKLRKDLEDSQLHQDRSSGELGLSLRRHIEEVAKKMHENEIWNRDNFVRKPELDAVRSDIKDLSAEMRTLVGDIQLNMQRDFKEAMRDLKTELASKN